MPFAAPIEDELDPNKKPDQQGQNVSGQSTSFNTNVPGQEGAAGGQKEQKSSGQYTNIQSYLDANKNQADQMGQKITSDVSSKADAATQKIQDFDTKAPTVQAYDPNEALGRVTSLSDQEKQTYKQNRQTGGYSGPQSIDQMEGYQDLQKTANDAISGVKNASTEQGQQQLLKQNYGRPQYSAGENKLDQVLLANSAGSKAGLEGLTQKYSNLDQLFGNTQSHVGQAIADAQTKAQANKELFNPAEQQAKEQLLNPIRERAAQANAYNGEYADRIMNDATDLTLNDETLQALGIDPGQRVYDMNLRNYITPDKTQLTLDNAANAQERNRYTALASLLDDPTMNQVTAGGKEIKPVAFNKEQYEADRLAKDEAFKKAAADALLSASGSSYDTFLGDQSYTANQRVSDYLNGGFNPTGGFDGLANSFTNSSQNYAGAINNARANLLSQINDWLNQRGYNNVIKKG